MGNNGKHVLIEAADGAVVGASRANVSLPGGGKLDTDLTDTNSQDLAGVPPVGTGADEDLWYDLVSDMTVDTSVVRKMRD